MLANNLIKNLIISEAKNQGFVSVGFAKVELLIKESEKLKQWIDNGYNAGMKWIEESFEKRRNISLIMSDAKSVISLAYNYFTPFTHSDNLPKISRYAWGSDYHKILKKKLKSLCRYIENIHSQSKSQTNGEKYIKTKYFIDDGPVMDKVWAVRAGIGWIGKHTIVINPDYGSWILLGLIITNIKFETYNQPIEGLCGSCRICIDACPEFAIVNDYELDANLCISYQTIENRREIPEDMELHNWIFGCDICQDVCPFNKNDKPTDDKNFYPKPEIHSKTIMELETIDEKEFNQIFSDSPIKKIKFSGWKKNIKRLIKE